MTTGLQGSGRKTLHSLILEHGTMTKRDRQASEYAAENNIVDRLREASHFALMDAARSLVLEAADEIERLQAQAKLDGETIGILVGECQAMLGRAIDGQEWSEKTAALLWKIQVQSNIISRLKVALEKR
jgi:hypothetical protein